MASKEIIKIYAQIILGRGSKIMEDS